ncbi:FkbM family methyltransferase [Flavobacterium gawalongense]|uniref:FkbM family methyltransferase n=1 Tax=Flavobacterium gawalongense TaxID=2594432 RepID=A0A553BZ12_9FLAO|nr:FkbM family methyltransferase [Flavobacterium gawalongense]TRX13479.1 FkbM family methyltransferase [Flavobacterium gawalongense]TRX15589.1 FkbM family methyltransferase [Flavobacterium gawalongense]TRX31427.1 FkbM family methyltransferase [Flavobacterium gawalongense]
MLNRIRELIRQRYNISFSKTGDDIQLMKLINNKVPGVYVDVGSWHPINTSNTYYFYLRNWKGICIDPNPELKSLYNKFRPKDNFINAGIGEPNTSLEYYMLEESSMNTFSNDFLKKHQLESKIMNKIKVPLYSLKEILDNALDENDRLDFFDIDVEGFDLEVLKSNDWDKYRPKAILIETDLPIQNDVNSEIVQYLKSVDYRLVAKSIISGDLGNLFLIDNQK